MNIGEFVKNIKKEYPSISISKVRFLEKEGFLKPIRSKGGKLFLQS
jgi:DNA-binding transcriptional MerR regulator